jgi:hypothetical protein
LTESDIRGWNVLRYLLDVHDEGLEFFFETYENILGKEGLEAMLKETGENLYSDDFHFYYIFQTITKYLDTKAIVTLTKHKYQPRLCYYLTEESKNEKSNNPVKQFELLSLITENCKWSTILRVFRWIQRNPEHKFLLRYRNDNNQTIFDVADAGGNQ